MKLPNNFFGRWVIISLAIFLVGALVITFVASIHQLTGAFTSFGTNGDIWEGAILHSLFVGFIIAYNYDPD